MTPYNATLLYDDDAWYNGRVQAISRGRMALRGIPRQLPVPEPVIPKHRDKDDEQWFILSDNTHDATY
jgi:hypothetical protein